MMDTMIFWIAIVVVLIFVLILCRRYLGRILIILLALAMIGGIFYLINPQGSTEIWNKVQTFTAFEKSEKNPDQYSRFASLFGTKTPQIQEESISTWTEVVLSGNFTSTGTVSGDLTWDSITNSGDALLSQNMLENVKKQVLLEEGIEKDDNGNYIFDANKFEVGVLDGKLIISAKKALPKLENGEDLTKGDDLDQDNQEEVSVEKVSESLTSKKENQLKKTVNTTSDGLSAQDLREAAAIFGK